MFEKEKVKSISDIFAIEKKLDEGSFGYVYKAKNRETGEVVAIKRFKQNFKNWSDCISLNEVKHLKALKHPNIIRLKEVIKDKKELFLIYEYANTNLLRFYTHYKKQNKSLSEVSIRNIISQIAKALHHIHCKGIIHRDIKPENILITKEGKVKLADFGFAKRRDSEIPFTSYISTRWYRAPEILLKFPRYDSPADVFALGCIMVR